MTERTLENFLCDNLHFSPKTAENYRCVIGGLLRYAEARTITARLIEEWSVWMMKGGRAAASIHMKRRLVAHVCRWSEEMGQGVQLVKKMKGLPHDTGESQLDRCVRPDEYRRIMAVEWAENDGFLREMVQCSWETGLRIGDCIRLQWASVDLEARSIRLQPNKTKNHRGTWIHVPLSEEFTEILKARRASRPEAVPDVWPEAIYEDRQEPGILSRKFTKYARRAGLPKGRCFHGLRHARVTTLLEAGESTAMVRAFTGHSLQVLERYAGHVSLEAKRAAFNRAAINSQQSAKLETNDKSLIEL